VFTHSFPIITTASPNTYSQHISEAVPGMSDHSRYSQALPRKGPSRPSGSRASASTAARSSSTLSPSRNSKALVLRSSRPRHTSSSDVSTGTRQSLGTALSRSSRFSAQQYSYPDGGQRQVQGRVPQDYFTSRPVSPPSDQPLFAVMEKVEERTTYWEDGIPVNTVPSVTYNTAIVTRDKLDEEMAAQLKQLELAQSNPNHRKQRQVAQSGDSQRYGSQHTTGRILGANR
jgi:hypothetical protein